eukprot:NODE_2146_length_1499_cov_30.012355_g2041_i0.p1 GENE.NODE_2146_length_1499_cov_30.012355_g2041_i0~~NODE_2146_length_1499_cov_30.012355_g2041_i0.p1  ORF type:complete len:439 (-),score=92.04 NODE_2146_length_1499_cov_30.012355_g2041_i0:46-1362(-)
MKHEGGKKKKKSDKYDFFYARVYAGFTQPPHTVVVSLDKEWNTDVVIKNVLELLDRADLLVPSVLPTDYTLRFETPADIIPIPKEAESIEFPGMVMEKSHELVDREARLEAERAPVVEKGLKALERRELLEYRQRMREEQARKAKEARVSQLKILLADRTVLERKRNEGISAVLQRRNERTEAHRQHCEDHEAARRAVWAAEKIQPQARVFKRPPERVRPLTKAGAIIGRLQTAIEEANELEEHFEQLQQQKLWEMHEISREKSLIGSTRKRLPMRSPLAPISPIHPEDTPPSECSDESDQSTSWMSKELDQQDIGSTGPPPTATVSKTLPSNADNCDPGAAVGGDDPTGVLALKLLQAASSGYFPDDEIPRGLSLLQLGSGLTAVSPTLGGELLLRASTECFSTLPEGLSLLQSASTPATPGSLPREEDGMDCVPSP